MSFLLDTNVVSELRKRPDATEPRVIAWADRQDIDDLFLSVITVMELELGIALVERRDGRQGAALRRWLDRAILAGFDDRILSVSLPVARRSAALHVPDPRPDRDAYIAATAQVHGLTVVTRNVADFAPLGVALLNPWDR